jgi:cobalamin biosynthesis protein CobD/CbiB
MVEDHWMNDGGRRDATVEDIRRGVRLYAIACILQAAMLAVFAVI